MNLNVVATSEYVLKIPPQIASFRMTNTRRTADATDQILDCRGVVFFIQVAGERRGGGGWVP